MDKPDDPGFVISETPLPPLYDRWMQALLGAPVAPETEATCDDCAMCREHAPTGLNTIFFKPDLKCCSFMPNLPNYLVGRILQDEGPGTEAGRASMEARIRAGVSVTPLGVDQTPLRRVMYESGGTQGFGKAAALRCPHFILETGLCGIWRHRNSVCTTWFCKHVRGAVGARFWSDLNRLLGRIEIALAVWCVLELGLEHDALRQIVEVDPGTKGPLSDTDLDGVPDPAAYRRVWGRWHGREREFYLEAARLVTPLSWDQVMAIGGPRLRLVAALVSDAHAKATSVELPEKLVPGRFEATPLPDGTVRVVSYMGHDPLVLPQETLQVLAHFDGRPVREVLASLERDEKLSIETDFILQLADFEILVPPPDAQPSS